MADLVEKMAVLAGREFDAVSGYGVCGNFVFAKSDIAVELLEDFLADGFG